MTSFSVRRGTTMTDRRSRLRRSFRIAPQRLLLLRSGIELDCLTAISVSFRLRFRLGGRRGSVTAADAGVGYYWQCVGLGYARPSNLAQDRVELVPAVAVQVQGRSSDLISWSSSSHGWPRTIQLTNAFSAIHAVRACSPSTKVLRFPEPTRRNCRPTRRPAGSPGSCAGSSLPRCRRNASVAGSAATGGWREPVARRP